MYVCMFLNYSKRIFTTIKKKFVITYFVLIKKYLKVTKTSLIQINSKKLCIYDSLTHI